MSLMEKNVNTEALVAVKKILINLDIKKKLLHMRYPWEKYGEQK